VQNFSYLRLSDTCRYSGIAGFHSRQKSLLKAQKTNMTFDVTGLLAISLLPFVALCVRLLCVFPFLGPTICGTLVSRLSFGVFAMIL
jgi:hypothetical protein